jgi:acyl-CoA reductase-like NAD-dependent aldehyde dehydrogenase
MLELQLTFTMAPLPLPERATPTPAGFLAALKTSEKDASTSTSWKAPSVESRARALELMSAIQRDEGSKLAAWAQRRRRGTGRNEAMYGTIRRVCDHTLPLADQVSISCPF